MFRFIYVVLFLLSLNVLLVVHSCLLLRYASQNSLDESSQKHVPRSGSKEKPPYHNNHHTDRAFEVMDVMRK